VVLIFIYPGVTKKTKINAHELEALRFILRFLLTRYKHTHTHYRQGALGWATASRWATASQRQGRAEQGAGQGARSAAAAGCMSAPTRLASINY